MRRQQEAVVAKRFHHQMLMREDADFDVLKIHSRFELPADEEFVCTSDEVREEFAILDGAHESVLD